MADADRLTLSLSSGGDVVIKLRPDLAPGHVAADHRTRQQRLLRRRRVPPGDPGLHGAGRRSDRHRHQRVGPAQPQGRIQPRTARSRHRFDGAHPESGQRQQPVLHLLRRRRASSTANTRCGARSRAAWSMSTRCPSASRRASRARSSRRRYPGLKKVALVTGASAGLGVEFARQLVEARAPAGARGAP